MIATEIKDSKIGRIRLKRVPNASSESLNNAIEQVACKGSVIQTDGRSDYNHLESLGYIHEIVRKDYDIVDSLLPHCHRVVALLKRWLLGTRQGTVSHENLDYYLDEFTFRFNRRTSSHRGKLFYRLLQNAVKIDPDPLKKLVKNARGRKSTKYNF